MMWVCRAGQKSIYAEYYFKTSKIYIPWDGFRHSLEDYKNRQELKELVKDEKGDVARTSISNWSGQLFTFCYEMKVGDYVLIPFNHSRNYALAKISGEYHFTEDAEYGLWHSRNIIILHNSIPNSIFNQSIRYSLGAYRTIFKARDEVEILAVIKKHIAYRKEERCGFR